MRTLLIFFLACVTLAAQAAAQAPVYMVLWFDTEDYIEPASDDAALRLAQDLERLGVRATFKIVGEKARVLEQRGRADVIRALARHDIGYHAETHSMHPAPAEYLRDLGWLEGASEFERREGQGVRDIRRIFGVAPSCYGQPGSSWGPQSYRALLRMGIPVYLDEGSQVGVNEQAFWLGGMLHVFSMGQFVLRPSLNDESQFQPYLRRFDEAVAALRARGGGMISSYYHPNEYVTTEFWDAVNFSRGANPERSEWKRPKRRTAEDSERCYRLLVRWAEHAKAAGVHFVTARDLPQIYASPLGRRYDRATISRHMQERQTFLAHNGEVWSAAEMLQVLLGLEPRQVEGPAERSVADYDKTEVPRPAFDRAKSDVASFIRTNGRLPSIVWIGSARLSLADFAATLAGAPEAGAVPVRKGNPEMERYVTGDPEKSFNWVIHPTGFSAPKLLELARLQTWTLKPAVLR